MADGATSLGTGTPGVVTIPEITIVGTDSANKAGGDNKAPASPAPAAPPSPDEYKKLVARAQSLGLKADYLDDQGNIKPEKVEEVKARVKQALDAKIKSVLAKYPSLKPEDNMATAMQYLPFLVTETEFSLLPPQEQKNFLATTSLNQKTLASYNPTQRPLHKQMAHAIRLEGLRQKEAGDLGAASRFFDTASQMDPESNSLHLQAANMKVAWANKETDPIIKAHLYEDAVAHFDAFLKANPGDKLASVAKGLAEGEEAKNLKLWSDTVTDPKEKKRLLTKALACLEDSMKLKESLFEKNPGSKAEALALKGQIFTGLGREAEARGADGEAQKAYAQGIDAASKKFDEDLAAIQKEPYPDVRAKRLKDELGASLKAIQEMPDGGSADAKILKLVCQRKLAQALYDNADRGYKAYSGPSVFKKVYVPYSESHNSNLVDDVRQFFGADVGTTYNKYEGPDPTAHAAYEAQKAKDLAPYKAEVDKVDAQINALRDGYRNELKSDNAATRMEAAKNLIAMDKKLGDNEALCKDLDLWKSAVDTVSSSQMNAPAQINEYSSMMKEWLGLRDQMVGTDTPLKLSLDGSKITDRMRNIIDRISERSGYIQEKGANDSVRHLLTDIVDGNDAKLRVYLSSSGMENYAKGLAVLNQKFEDAKKIPNIQERRTALLGLMGEFAKMRASREMEPVIQSLKDSVKDQPDTVKLQVYMGMNQVLGGTGITGENWIKGEGTDIAKRMLSAPGKDNKETVQNYVMAQQYFSSTQDAKNLAEANAKLEALRPVLLFSLTPGGAAATDPKKRIETVGLLMQIDLALVPKDIETTGKRDEDGKKSFNSTLKTKFELYRSTIVNSKEISTGDKLALLGQLGALEASYLEGSKGKDPAIDSAVLTEANGKLETDLQNVFASHVTATDHPLNETEKKILDAVKADFKNRVHAALVDGKADWLGSVNGDSAVEFALQAQNAEVLFMSAQTPNNPLAAQQYLQAAQIFSTLGLKERVGASIKPVMDDALKNPDVGQRVATLLNLTRICQETGMKDQANQIFDSVIAMDTPGASKDLHETAQLMKAMKAFNEGDLDKAKKELEAMPKDNALAQTLLKQIETGQKQYQIALPMAAIRSTMASYVQSAKDKGWSNVSKMETEMGQALDEMQRLMTSGKCKNFGEALDIVAHGKFGSFGAFIFETGSGWKLKSYLDGIQPGMTDQALAERTLGFAKSLKGDSYYGAAGMIGQTLYDNLYVGKDAKKLVEEEIPADAKWDAIVKAGTGLLYFTPLAPAVAFGQITFSSTTLGEENSEYRMKESLKAVVTDAVVARATFGFARFARVGVEAAFVARAGSLITNPTTLRVAGFVVGSATEAAAFTTGNMVVQSMMTGRVDNWTLKNFGKEFGSMLVTFVLLHGVNMGMQKVGKAAEGVSFLKAAPGEAGQLKSAGQLALSPGAQKAFQFVSWGVRVGSFTATESINEAVGLKQHENVPFWMRLLSSAITDAQMMRAGKEINAIKIGNTTMGGIEAQTHQKYAMADMLPELKKMGFEIDPKKVFGQGIDPTKPPATPAEAVLRVLVQRSMMGEPLPNMDEKDVKAFDAVVTDKFGVKDPKSPEGQALKAQLLFYAMAHGEGGKPMTPTELGLAVEEIKVSAKVLVTKSGIKEGSPLAQSLSDNLLMAALQQGISPKNFEAMIQNAPDLKDRLHDVVNTVMGKGGSGTPEGQFLMGQLLMRAVLTAKEPGKLSDTLEGLTDAITDTKDALRVTVNSLLGPGASSTPQGRELMAVLLLRTMKNSPNMADIPGKLADIGNAAHDVGEALRAHTSMLLGEKASQSPEGRLIVSRLFLAALKASPEADNLFSVTEKVTEAMQMLNGPTPNLFDLTGAKAPFEKTALIEWAFETNQTPESLKAFTQKLNNGEVDAKFEKGKMTIVDIPPEKQADQKKIIFDRVPLLEISPDEVKSFSDMKAEFYAIYADPISMKAVKTAWDIEKFQAKLAQIEKAFGNDPEFQKEITNLHAFLNVLIREDFSRAINQFEKGSKVEAVTVNGETKYYQTKKSAFGDYRVEVQQYVYEAYEKWHASLEDVTAHAKLIESTKPPPLPKKAVAEPPPAFKAAARSAPGADVINPFASEGTPIPEGAAVLSGVDAKIPISFGDQASVQKVKVGKGEMILYGDTKANSGKGQFLISHDGKGGDVKIHRADGRVETVKPGTKGQVELSNGDTVEMSGQKIKFYSPAEVAARSKANTEWKGLQAERQALKANPDAAKETDLNTREADFKKRMEADNRTFEGTPYSEKMPQVAKDVSSPILDGKFVDGEGKTVSLFDAKGEVIPEARAALRDQMVANLQAMGMKVSTDNVKAVDSIIDLALTARSHGIIDKPGGISRAQFNQLVGELYFHNNPEIRIGATELTHVPMVVEGTLNHFETAMAAQGKKVSVADKKALFVAALLHDAGKWDPGIRTETGYTILATSPFNKSGKDIVVSGVSEKYPKGQSLSEALAEQGIDPKQVTLPFPGMAAVLVHHDAANVRTEVNKLVEQGLLTKAEGEQVWQAIQYHGFVSSWIVNNSLGGLGIKSHVFDNPQLQDFFSAFQRVSKKLGEKGIPADLKTLMTDPAFAEDAKAMQDAFGKLPPMVQALMLGDHQGQIDIAKYMTILSGSPANKDASVYDLFYGNSMVNSVMGVLRTHTFEQSLLSPQQGEAAKPAFDAAEKWLQGEGLAKAIQTLPEFQEWAKDHPNPDSVDAVKSWLRTVKVKVDGKPSPEFQKIQALVEKAFYDFSTVKGTSSEFKWADAASVKGTKGGGSAGGAGGAGAGGGPGTADLPAIPVKIPPPLPVEREGTPAGLIMGGSGFSGVGTLVPKDGSVKPGAVPGAEFRYNVNGQHYEYRMEKDGNPGEWQKLEVGQKIMLDGKPFIFGELRGIPKPDKAGAENQFHDLHGQIKYQLATEGAKHHLADLKAQGRSVDDVDAANLSLFYSKGYEDAVLSHDSGNPIRRIGGLFGGTNQVFAFVDPATGQIQRFAVRTPPKGDEANSPLWVVQKGEGGKLQWVDSADPRRTEPLNMEGIPPNAVIVPMKVDRMNGRLSIDKAGLKDSGLSEKAAQKMENLDGYTAQVPGPGAGAFGRYMSGEAIKAKTPEVKSDNVVPLSKKKGASKGTGADSEPGPMSAAARGAAPDLSKKVLSDADSVGAPKSKGPPKLTVIENKDAPKPSPMTDYKLVAEGNGDVGTLSVYRAKVKTADGVKEVTLRLSPDLTAENGGPEGNLRVAFRNVEVGKTYEMPDGSKVQYTGNVLGQGSGSTIFEAKVRTPSGEERTVAIKIRTHAQPPAFEGEDAAHFNRAEWEADIQAKTVQEGKIQEEVGKIDPKYAGLGVIDMPGGQKGLMMPLFDPATSTFFVRLSALPADEQAVVRPQVEKLIQDLVDRGHSIGDIEFVFDKTTGKVHIVDMEGIGLHDVDVNNPAAKKMEVEKAKQWYLDVPEDQGPPSSMPPGGGGGMPSALNWHLNENGVPTARMGDVTFIKVDGEIWVQPFSDGAVELNGGKVGMGHAVSLSNLDEVVVTQNGKNHHFTLHDGQLLPMAPLGEGGEAYVFALGDGKVMKIYRSFETAQARADQEANVLSQVQKLAETHPEIRDFAPVLEDHANHPLTNTPALVMSKVPGKSVADMTPEERKQIPEEAWERFAGGLKVLNDNGIFHNDIVAQNIMWDGSKLRLIDFGGAIVSSDKVVVGKKGGSFDLESLALLRNQIADGKKTLALPGGKQVLDKPTLPPDSLLPGSFDPNKPFPGSAGLPSVDTEKRGGVGISIYEKLYPIKEVRPGYVGSEIIPEIETTIQTLREQGQSKMADQVQKDFQTALNFPEGSPEYDKAISRLVIVLDVSRHESKLPIHISSEEANAKSVEKIERRFRQLEFTDGLKERNDALKAYDEAVAAKQKNQPLSDEQKKVLEDPAMKEKAEERRKFLKDNAEFHTLDSANTPDSPTIKHLEAHTTQVDLGSNFKMGKGQIFRTPQALVRFSEEYLAKAYKGEIPLGSEVEITLNVIGVGPVKGKLRVMATGDKVNGVDVGSSGPGGRLVLQVTFEHPIGKNGITTLTPGQKPVTVDRTSGGRTEKVQVVDGEKSDTNVMYIVGGPYGQSGKFGLYTVFTGDYAPPTTDTAYWSQHAFVTGDHSLETKGGKTVVKQDSNLHKMQIEGRVKLPDSLPLEDKGANDAASPLPPPPPPPPPGGAGAEAKPVPELATSVEAKLKPKLEGYFPPGTKIHTVTAKGSTPEQIAKSIQDQVPAELRNDKTALIVHIEGPGGKHLVVADTYGNLTSSAQIQFMMDGSARSKIFHLDYQVSYPVKDGPPTLRVGYFQADTKLRESGATTDAAGDFLDYAKQRYPGAKVETQASNFISLMLMGRKLGESKFVEGSDPKKYPIQLTFDKTFIDTMAQAGVIKPEDAAYINGEVAKINAELEVAKGRFKAMVDAGMMTQGQANAMAYQSIDPSRMLALHNFFIGKVCTSFDEAKKSGDTRAKDEVNFLMEKFSKAGGLKMIKENPYRGDLWVEGKLPGEWKADMADTPIAPPKPKDVPKDEPAKVETDPSNWGDLNGPDFKPVKVVQIQGKDYDVSVAETGEGRIYQFTDMQFNQFTIMVPKGQSMEYLDGLLSGGKTRRPDADPGEMAIGLVSRMAEKNPDLLKGLEDYQNRTGNGLPVVALYELSLKAPIDAARILDNAKAYKGFKFQVNGKQGSGEVEFTGEILGIGSARTIYKGFFTNAKGEKVPVAIKMPPGGDVKNLIALDSAEAGGARFFGAAEIRWDQGGKPVAKMPMEQGPTALITNLADGVLVKGLHEAPPEYQDQVYKEMAEDIGKLVPKGYVDFADRNFIIRTSAGPGRRLQWIDLEGVSFKEPPKPEEVKQRTRDALTKMGVPQKYWPAELQEGAQVIPLQPKKTGDAALAPTGTDAGGLTGRGILLKGVTVGGKAEGRVLGSGEEKEQMTFSVSANGDLVSGNAEGSPKVFSLARLRDGYRIIFHEGVKSSEVTLVSSDGKSETKNRVGENVKLPPGEYKVIVGGKEVSFTVPKPDPASQPVQLAAQPATAKAGGAKATVPPPGSTGKKAPLQAVGDGEAAAPAAGPVKTSADGVTKVGDKTYFLGYEITPQFEQGLHLFLTPGEQSPFVDFNVEGAKVALDARNYGRPTVEGFQDFQHIVDRHAFESPDRHGKPAGIYKANVDIEIISRETVSHPDRVQMTFDENGKVCFVFEKDFPEPIGNMSDINKNKPPPETRTNRVIFADGKIQTSFPVKAPSKEAIDANWVSMSKLPNPQDFPLILSRSSNAKADTKKTYEPFYPDSPDAQRGNLYLTDMFPVKVVNERTRADYYETDPAGAANKKTYEYELSDGTKVTVAEKKFDQPIGVRETQGPNGEIIRTPLYWNRTYYYHDKTGKPIIGGYPIGGPGEAHLPQTVWDPSLRPKPDAVAAE